MTAERCTICFENISNNNRYPPLNASTCKHSTCHTCFIQYLDETLTCYHQKNYETILCPNFDCTGKFITAGLIEKVYNKEDAIKWWEIVYKRTCMPNKIYCPMENCGAVMEGDPHLKKTCTFIICHKCNRGFCSACQKKWHPNKNPLFDKSEEHTAYETAKKRHWARCPKCGIVVEKLDGCAHMTCLCGVVFCYRCGRATKICEDSCVYYVDKEIQRLRDDMFK